MRIAAAVGVGLLAAVPIAPALAATKDVRVGNYYFEDATAGDGRVVVDEGDRITFTFEGNTPHTATVAGMFDSGRRAEPETYTTQPLTRAGSYTLFCQVHGVPNHSATLVIRPAAAPSPTASPTRRATPKATPSPTPSAIVVRTTPPAPAPTATRAVASPSPSRAAAPTPTRSPSPVRTIAAPTTSAPAAQTALPTDSPDPVAAEVPRPLAEDDGGGLLLPVALVLLALLTAGLVATAIALRRRRL